MVYHFEVREENILNDEYEHLRQLKFECLL